MFFLLLMAGLNLFQLLLYPYHLAPVVPVIFCLVALGSQKLYVRLAALSDGRARCFGVFLPLLLLIVFGLKQFGEELDVPPSSYWERGYEWHRDARAAVVEWLNKRPGKHLVIVRYADDHPVNQEWVYNGADLDAAKILWARELGPDASRKLLQYYSTRVAWLLEADLYPPRVVPYVPLEGQYKPAKNCAPCSLPPATSIEVSPSLGQP